jgi:hypothetical protein
LWWKYAYFEETAQTEKKEAEKAVSKSWLKQDTAVPACAGMYQEMNHREWPRNAR